MNNENKKNKRPVMLLTAQGSHIDLLDRNFNIFSERYSFIKYEANSEYPQYIKDLEGLVADILEKDKEPNNLTVVMVDSILFREEYAKILKYIEQSFPERGEVETPTKPIPKFNTERWDDLEANFINWFKFFKYIQDFLDNEICFLFTTYYRKDKFVSLIAKANEVGLRSFRFIEDPFLTRELDTQLNHLILRFYTNKVIYNKRMNQRRKMFKKAE